MKTAKLASLGVAATLTVGVFYAGYRVSTAELRSAANQTAETAVTNGIQVASSNDNVVFADPSGFDGLQLYNEVLSRLKAEYVDGLERGKEDNKLAYGTIRGLLAHLEDPTSRFLEPEEVQAYLNATEGTLSGIGAVLTTDHRVENNIPRYVLEVVAPMPGSPAEKAGLRAGDVIDAVNGQWVLSYNLGAELEPLRRAVRNKKASPAELIKAAREATAKQENAILVSEAVKKLSEPNAEPLRLKVKREGQKDLFEVSVQPARIQVEPVEYKLLNDRWGYVHLRMLNSETAADLNSALNNLKPRMQGLVLDLRNNPGGKEEYALKTLSALLPSNTVVAHREARKGDKNKQAIKVTQGQKLAVPIVVLTSEGTNNTSELVAAALREKAGARLVGTPTHGDAAVHSHFGLKDGSMIILSTGKYYTPKGATFAGNGLKPDATVADKAALGEPNADPPLKRALDLLAKGGR